MPYGRLEIGIALGDRYGARPSPSPSASARAAVMNSLGRGRGRWAADSVGAAVEAVRATATDLSDPADLDAIVEAAADASYVLIGEASHGTSEFYRWRARLTARLIRELDVAFVGVEGDWTDCYDVNRHVRHRDDVPDGTVDILDGFDRWPTWMWANWEVVEFVRWLREHNADLPDEQRVGFYGLDVYGLYESMEAVVDYLEGLDPELARRARDAYHCFAPYGEDAREYSRSTRLVPEDCEDEVIDVLRDLQRAPPTVDGTGTEGEGDRADPETRFNAEQNALVAKNAEEYYRAMAKGSSESWNVRDRHMAETLDRLADRPQTDGIAVVWAHNTHVGDARATDMTDRGKVNIGQLVRERHGEDEVLLVGCGTHRGSVVASDEWDAPTERMTVPPATETSWGDVFHRAGVGDASVVFEGVADRSALEPARGHRAIGVVYHPDRELGNYVPTTLPERYDAFLHVEETSALHPLREEPGGSEPPETFPWGV